MLTHRAFAFLGLTVALAATVHRSLVHQSQHSRSDHSSGPKNQQPGATEKQPVAASAPTKNSANQAEEREHRRAERRYWKWSVAGSLAAAVPGLVGLYIAAGALDASRKAVKEASNQASMAGEANRISREAFTSSEMATVYFSNLGIRPIPQPNSNLLKTAIYSKIGNSGGSPTRDLTYAFACKPSATLIDDPYDRKLLSAAKIWHATLAPKEIKEPMACIYTMQEMVLVPLQNLMIYVIGIAHYRDSVDDSVIHGVEFCQRFFDFSFQHGLFGLAEDCEKHNCRDKDCKAE